VTDGPDVAELRTDWLTGRTVILAENRALRPNEFAVAESSAASSNPAMPCPFCPGQESLTPPAVYTLADDRGHWRVRVVPNKFPALTLGDAVAVGPAVPAVGAHEVLIESARHVDRMSALSVTEFADVLATYRQRLAHWHDDGRFAYGLVFKNLGPAAGASLAHVHSQLIATPHVPPPVAAEFQRAEQFFAEQGACAYCRLIDRERLARERVVLERDGLIAFCPFASLQPWEVWLMPTEHDPWCERQPHAKDAAPLAETLHALLVRVESVVPQPDYNLLLRTSPWRESAGRCGHWRIEILPRVNPLAGLELASHIHINPLSPSRAAEQLRSS
jgi:UDPglucose--hexose-1-phosphate uridylyltransferase